MYPETLAFLVRKQYKSKTVKNSSRMCAEKRDLNMTVSNIAG